MNEGNIIIDANIKQLQKIKFKLETLAIFIYLCLIVLFKPKAIRDTLNPSPKRPKPKPRK